MVQYVSVLCPRIGAWCGTLARIWSCKCLRQSSFWRYKYFARPEKLHHSFGIIYLHRYKSTINCHLCWFTGAHNFIALGEIYRVAQILHLSLQCFKPWVLAHPGMFSKMLSCLDSCTNAWTSGLETALKMVIDSNHIHAAFAKALMDSIKNITKLEAPNLQKNIPKNEMKCRLTLLPSSLVPGKTPKHMCCSSQTEIFSSGILVPRIQLITVVLNSQCRIECGHVEWWLLFC